MFTKILIGPRVNGFSRIAAEATMKKLQANHSYKPLEQP